MGKGDEESNRFSTVLCSTGALIEIPRMRCSALRIHTDMFTGDYEAGNIRSQRDTIEEKVRDPVELD